MAPSTPNVGLDPLDKPGVVAATSSATVVVLAHTP
jgi:hypothetical protein